jgi:restriction system protein
LSRRRSSVAEDLIAATAKVPWWVGVVLAVVSYAVLHAVASIDIPPASELQQFAYAASKQLFKQLASIFQYVFPLIFLMGSVFSVIGRRKRVHLYGAVKRSDSALATMTWQDFELLVSEFFRRRGFSVKETGGGGADGGVDLIISSGNDRYVVQCKKWKAVQVGVATVRELYGVMTAMGAIGGFVVTSGTFTNDAKRFVDGREIELIDAEYLLREIGQDQISDRAQQEPRPASAIPACPQCGSSMVMRAGRKGSRAGDRFWGCSTFPKCRGTRQATVDA